MRDVAFSRQALVVLLASAIALFALSILLPAYNDDPISEGDRTRPGAYSLSALGHAGVYDLLRRLGYPVTRGISNPLALAGSRGTLIVAEPGQGSISSDEGIALLHAQRLLLVLPKWRGAPDPDRPAWIKQAELLSVENAQSVFGLASWEGLVVRSPWPEQWKINTTGVTPAGSGVVQLIRSSALRPLIGNNDGMLLGELVDGERKVLVLADPDILANHGIVKGDNAALMAALIDSLRQWNDGGGDAPVVFDETVHGYHAAHSSPVKLLFRFPFVIVTALFAASAILLALAGSGRFGAPLPAKPELDFGKASLIANGAKLLDYAGHHAVVLQRYVLMVIRSTGKTLHAPAGLDDAALAAWLDRIGKARKVSGSCVACLQTAAAPGNDSASLARLLACAHDIHRWKGELLHGSGTHRHHR